MKKILTNVFWAMALLFPEFSWSAAFVIDLLNDKL